MFCKKQEVYHKNQIYALIVPMFVELFPIEQSEFLEQTWWYISVDEHLKPPDYFERLSDGVL